MITINGEPYRQWFFNDQLHSFVFKLASKRLQEEPEMETSYARRFHKHCSDIEQEDLVINP